MKQEKKLHIRVSDPFMSDLDRKVELLKTSKSEYVRTIIEREVYKEDNILSKTNILPIDSPFNLTDFTQVILKIAMGTYMDRAYQYHVEYYISIMERDFEKLDIEMKQILLPFLKDLVRLQNDIEEKPDARHYYMFEIDIYSLRVYLNQNVLLY